MFSIFESDNKRNKLIISDFLYDVLVVLAGSPNRESKSLLGHTSIKNRNQRYKTEVTPEVGVLGEHV